MARSASNIGWLKEVHKQLWIGKEKISQIANLGRKVHLSIRVLTDIESSIKSFLSDREL